MKKILFYNTLIFLILYFTVEILSGTVLFNRLDCHYLLCEKKIKYKSSFNIYKNNLTFYEKDKYGFRGRTKSLKNIDILTIGGSTTDERYLRLEDTWSEKLEKKFKKQNINIDVVNAGIDGQSTRGHIWNFYNWFNKLDNFKPKYLIFYIGINERFTNNRSGFDNDFILTNKSLKNKILLLIKKNNGITYKLYDKIIRKYFLKDYINVGHKKREPLYKLVENDRIITIEQKKYLEKNLVELVNLSKKINAVPIFVTQKTLRGYRINNYNYSIDPDFDVFSYEKQISNIISNYSIKNNINFVDLNKNIKFNLTDFYDLVHTTPKGSEKIAEEIFKNIKNLVSF